jgi:thiosulfate/3-mercaptopyruvate sulfurtransferase
MEALVSVGWLSDNLDRKDLVLLEASLHPVPLEQDIEGASLSIPNTRFFDIKNCFSDTDSVFPNTLPSEAVFEVACQQLGIGSTSQIVVFDRGGIFSSPRVRWMFLAMGHKNIAVLDGGLRTWKKQGFPLEKLKKPAWKNGDFKANFDTKYIKYYKDIIKNLNDEKFTVVDARSVGRFKGIAPEPRNTLQSGQIPDALNIPYTAVLKDGFFKNKTELQQLFNQKITDNKELVFSCGSGITACIVMLACEISFKKHNCVYDGSWTEWATLRGLFLEDS